MQARSRARLGPAVWQPSCVISFWLIVGLRPGRMVGVPSQRRQRWSRNVCGSASRYTTAHLSSCSALCRVPPTILVSLMSAERLPTLTFIRFLAPAATSVYDKTPNINVRLIIAQQRKMLQCRGTRDADSCGSNAMPWNILSGRSKVRRQTYKFISTKVACV